MARNLFESDQQIKAPVGRNLFDQQEQTPSSQPGEKPAIKALREKTESQGSSLTDVAAEFAAAINRGVVDVADFFTTDQINAVLSMAGSEKRVPSLKEIPGIKQGTTGGFMEEGIGRDVVQTAGEFTGPGALSGAAIRAGTKMLPKATMDAAKIGTAGEAAKASARAMSGGTAAGDVGFSALSGAGQAVGEDIGGEAGGAVGSVLVPVLATSPFSMANMAKTAYQVHKASKSVKDGVDQSATLLAQAMQREGITPEEAANRLKKLGPEALPADIGQSFRRLLRTASNKIPIVEGQARVSLDKRASSSYKRVLDSIDESGGLKGMDVDTAIENLNKSAKPAIDEAYDLARRKSIEVFEATPKQAMSRKSYEPGKTKMRALLRGSGIPKKASQQAQRELKAKMQSGQEVTYLDVIDANKRALDDMIQSDIRQGKKNNARTHTLIKKNLLDEIEQILPEYRKARSLFAGKAQLEEAAEIGKSFNKMKVTDMKEYVSTLGDSEKKFFKLGAQQAIMEKIDSKVVNADLVKALFGKHGDIKKMRMFFDDEKQFNKFKDTMEREAVFNLTRAKAQANSTTAEQLTDQASTAEEAFKALRDSLFSPLSHFYFVNKMLKGLDRQKGSIEYFDALTKAGDILVMKGMKPKEIERLLKKGNEGLLKKSVIDIARQMRPKGLSEKAGVKGRRYITVAAQSLEDE